MCFGALLKGNNKSTRKRNTPENADSGNDQLLPFSGVLRFRRAHTNGGVQQRPLLRRVLRRVLETAFEKVLRRVLRRCLAMGFIGKKGSEKGS